MIVFGASGFIGRWLVDALIKQGICTVVVCRKNSVLPSAFLENNIVKVVRVESLSKLNVDDIPKRKYDVFYNLAWGGVENNSKNNIALQIENLILSSISVSK